MSLPDLLDAWRHAGVPAPFPEAEFMIKLINDEGYIFFFFFCLPKSINFTLPNTESWNRPLMTNGEVASLNITFEFLSAHQLCDQIACDVIWRIAVKAYGSHRLSSGHGTYNK